MEEETGRKDDMDRKRRGEDVERRKKMEADGRRQERGGGSK